MDSIFYVRICKRQCWRYVDKNSQLRNVKNDDAGRFDGVRVSAVRPNDSGSHQPSAPQRSRPRPDPQVDWQLAGADTVTIVIALLIGFIGGASAAYLRFKK